MNLISRKSAFSALLLAALLMAGTSQVWAAAVITGVEGEVLVARQATPEDWKPITTDTPLENGDAVKTRSGSCTLSYSDQATFALSPNSQISVMDEAATQNINLVIGNLRGRVNKERALKPFQVVTPAAVAAIRGTEVDFGFNDEGEMTVDLHDGNIQVLNDAAALTLDLAGNKQIKIKYDKESNTLIVKNECSSDGKITFNVLGTEYAENPCDEQTIDLATGENSNGPPGTPGPNGPENPDEGREPVSPNQP